MVTGVAGFIQEGHTYRKTERLYRKTSILCEAERYGKYHATVVVVFPGGCANLFIMPTHVQGGPKNRTSAMVAIRKACDMSKVLECCRQKGPNMHSKLFKYSLPNLHKSSLPLKLGIWLHSTPICPSSLNSKTHCQKVQI